MPREEDFDPDALGLPESPAEMRRRWRNPEFRRIWPMPDAEAAWLGPPGPNFEAYASALAGGVPPPPEKGLRGKARAAAAEAAAPAIDAYAARRRWALHFAYLKALYDPTFTLPIDLRGTSLTAQLVPGMRHVPKGIRHGPCPRARVVVVGKCPGIDEEQHSMNFVGPASEDLFRALRELDLADIVVLDTRDRRGGGSRHIDCLDIGPVADWYWTNACKWRNLDPASAQLRTDWLKDGRPLLRAEIHLLRPDFLLCLGSEASKELLGPKASVTALIGRVLTLDRFAPPRPGKSPRPPILAAAVVHPAAVARKPEMYPDLLQGLTAFKQLIDGERQSDIEPDLAHEVIYDHLRLREVVDRIVADGAGRRQAIAVDCEWHGKNPADPKAYLRTVQFCHRPKEAYCVVLRAAGGRPAFNGPQASLVAQLNRLLKSDPAPGGRKVRFGGHFIRADLPWLVHLGVDARPEARVARTAALSKTAGGFDTAYLVHGYQEAVDGGYKLEALAARFCAVPRYDVDLQAWKEDYCKSRGLKAGQLDGYGMCPDETLYDYSLFDADATMRLFERFNGVDGKPGLVDGDRRGLSGREGYWNNMVASPAALEMEGAGLFVDRRRVDELTRLYEEALALNIASFRATINWNARTARKRDNTGNVVYGPDGEARRVVTHSAFNAGSADHCREWLYGVPLNGKRNKLTGGSRRLSPADVATLDLTPVKVAGSKAPTWEKAQEKGITLLVNASTDRETLGILANTPGEKGKLVGKLRDLRFLGQVLKGTLRPPAEDFAGDPVFDLQGNLVYEGGLAYHTGHDGRVRTHFGVVETSRWSSWAPNCQNISKRREEDYLRILGADKYRYPIRSMLMSGPRPDGVPTVLVEADYKMAEMAILGWLAGDGAMDEHVRRNSLAESDPGYLDLHAMTAIGAFNLDNPENRAVVEAKGLPWAMNKSVLKALGKGSLRVGAKCVVAGTRLHTDRGWLRVEDVASACGEGEWLPRGDGIMLANDREPTPLVGVFNGGFKPCLKVVTERGYDLVGAADHRYKIVGADGAFCWRRADELRAGDWMCLRVGLGPFGDDDLCPPPAGTGPTSFKPVPFPERFDDNWAAFLGLYVTEGCCDTAKGSVQIGLKAGTKFAVASERLMLSLFGERLQIDRRDEKLRMRVTSTQLARWLAEHFGEISHLKKVPDFVFRWPSRLVRTFLSWSFEGDGSAKRNGRSFSITYCSKSERLAKDMQLLLGGFAVVASRRKEFRASTGCWYSLLYVCGLRSRLGFVDRIGFVTADKQGRCTSDGAYNLDQDCVPNQQGRLGTLLPLLAGTARAKCKECLREKNPITLTPGRLALVLSGIDAARCDDEQLSALVALREIAGRPISFQRLASVEDAGLQQVFDVTTTGDHTVSYDNVLTHQSVNFGVPYGRSAEAIARQCREEGADVTVAQAQELVDNYFATYPRIAEYLEACKARVLDPGWIAGTWGHIRRAGETKDQKVIADQQRQFMNANIQGGVAGTINLACRELFNYRRRHGDESDPARWFTFCLQIHDALLFEVPVPSLEWFMQEVLEECMSRRVPIYPRDLDGVPIPGAGPHHLAIDSEVMRHWGIPPDRDWAAAAGIPEKYTKH